MPDLIMALVLEDRPQISIQIDPTGWAQIATAKIGDDFERVEHEMVRIPWQDLPVVVETLQKIVDDNGIE